jgi:endoglucanase
MTMRDRLVPASAATLALAVTSFACVAPAKQGPAAAPAAPPPAAAAGTPGAATTAVNAADWNAPPTNGSPGLDVPKLSGNDLIKNVSFDGGKYIPWMNSFSATGAGRSFLKDGQFCTEVTNKGINPWDAQVRHREMTIVKGHTYSISFMAHATQPIRAKVKVGMAGPPYKEYWADVVDLTTHPQTFVGMFTMAADDDPTAELAFHFGGGSAAQAQTPYMLCLDDVHLDDPKFVRAKGEQEAPVPNVLVNQTGYLPRLPKIATVKSASKTPLKWELHKHGGGVVASGETKVLGKDEASGDEVHIADFSSVQTPGKGYTLKVGSDVSHPFDIEPDVYKKLKYDALAYFYHNRSGIEILPAFVGAKDWARPAGHLSDKAVPCLAKSATTPGCDYKLDVSGGWYDAGDHGKYVVNGGISAWTMMNQYERAKAFGSADAFADGKLNIPERKNGVPDILDEARWEMDFMLKMQVPDGQPKAGMVHHKIHDIEWTALGMRPDEDPKQRFLWPPSTAATLNLAATGAQCARIFEKIDKAFAGRCLTAAEKAWKAAEAHPRELAGTSAVGGGPYDDKELSDETYWAAAELFITTGKDVYKDAVQKSPHYTKLPVTIGDEGLPTSMTWGDVAALGTISLAVVPNKLHPVAVGTCKAAIETAADAYLAIIEQQGYRVPFKPGKKGYPWGSNSFVLNNAIVMALAHDFTGEPKYLQGVAEAMNYILGRNPLDRSYVTGYGERPLEHPHHRFWAHQTNARFPSPPPGAVSGGPNSGLQDPYVQAAGLAGCAPEKCFVDNIEAWSANEIAINWNTPLAWVAAYLDEKGEASGSSKGHKEKGARASKK